MIWFDFFSVTRDQRLKWVGEESEKEHLSISESCAGLASFPSDRGQQRPRGRQVIMPARPVIHTFPAMRGPPHQADHWLMSFGGSGKRRNGATHDLREKLQGYNSQADGLQCESWALETIIWRTKWH